MLLSSTTIIARTVSAVWRQEKLAKQAEEIGALGKELYIRLSKMGEHITKLYDAYRDAGIFIL